MSWDTQFDQQCSLISGVNWYTARFAMEVKSEFFDGASAVHHDTKSNSGKIKRKRTSIPGRPLIGPWTRGGAMQCD